jgi:signal transduction histidine kinase
VNDILDLERLESGKVQLAMEPCQVNDLMQMALESVQVLALEADITLHNTPLNLQLNAAPDAIVQTLTNLLGNAIKFSSPGSVVWLKAAAVSGDQRSGIGLRPERSAEGDQGSGIGDKDQEVGEIQHSNFPPVRLRENGVQHLSATPYPRSAEAHGISLSSTPHVLFTVKDQGRGVPADKLDNIFGRFQQVDVSDARQKGGTGLGLAICKSIVQQHGGQIWAESVVGQGSTFYFTLPLLNQDQTSEAYGETNSCSR